MTAKISAVRPGHRRRSLHFLNDDVLSNLDRLSPPFKFETTATMAKGYFSIYNTFFQGVYI
jgi:hypothetical protein